MMSNLFTALASETSDLGRSIIGVGPAMVDPLFSNVVNCDFGKDPIAEVNPVVTILGRGKNQFCLGDVTRI